MPLNNLLYIAMQFISLSGLPLIGWIIADWHWVDTRKPILSKFISLVLLPIVVFRTMLNVGQSIFLMFPIIYMLLWCTCMVVFARFTRRWRGKQILETEVEEAAWSYLNIGWFGIPFVNLFFGPEHLHVVIAAYLGNSLWGATFVLGSLSRTTQNNNSKLSRPLIFIICVAASGLILGKWGWVPSSHVDIFFGISRQVLSILGLVFVGIAARGNSKEINNLNQLIVFYARSWIWRSLAGLFVSVFLLSSWQLFINPGPQLVQAKILLTFCFFPVAGQLVVYLSLTNKSLIEPGRFVLFSTFIACVTAPAFVFVINLSRLMF